MSSFPRFALCLFAALAAPQVAAAQPATGTAPDSPAQVAAESTAVQAGEPATPPSFEGIWLLDAARSDDSTTVPRMGGPGGGRRGGGLPPPGGGRGGMGPGGGGGPGGPPGGMRGGEGPGEEGAGGGSLRRAFDRIAHPPKKLVLFLDKDQLEVTEDEGRPRLYLIVVGAGAGRDDGDDAKETATATVEGRRLVAREPLGRGALVEAYEIAEDGRTLTIRTRREGGPQGMPALEFKRVYTRYEGE